MIIPKRFPWRLISPGTIKATFIHIPKCGGTYLERMFTPYIQGCPTRTLKAAQGHLTLQEYQQVFSAHSVSFSPVDCFSVVRNPWAWHVSWFNYIKQDVDGKSGHQIEHELFQAFEFRDYLQWLIDPNAERGPQGYIQRQLSDWLIDEREQLVVPTVFRQETLQTDIQAFSTLHRLKVKATAIRLNTSSSRSFREYYDREGAEIIRKRHERDISLFGYEF